MLSTAQAYTLSYSWPYRLIGPLFLVLSVTFPVLIRYGDGKTLGASVWFLAVGLAVFGIGMILYHAKRVVVTEDALTFASPLRTRSVSWADLTRVYIANGKFVLIDGASRTYSVDMQLTNGHLFTRDLDAHFAAEGVQVPSS